MCSAHAQRPSGHATQHAMLSLYIGLNEYQLWLIVNPTHPELFVTGGNS
eukprot:COSAG01_NODE_25400_length_746_cov_1.199382_3_plen_48_part_01